LAANSGEGFLCHQCAKAGGNDPFKKSTPKKRKAPADKRNITTFEEKRSPSLVSICIQVSRTTPLARKHAKNKRQLITKHIDDIEALGDIGSMNVEAISKALSKNRGLLVQNGFYHFLFSPGL
jgi:DNA repair protein RAD7